MGLCIFWTCDICMGHISLRNSFELLQWMCFGKHDLGDLECILHIDTNGILIKDLTCRGYTSGIDHEITFIDESFLRI